MKLTAMQRTRLFALFDGKCAYCGHALPAKGWHADHLEAIHRKSVYVRINKPGRTYRFQQTGEMYNPAADRIGNLVPSCRACNIDKADMALETWRRRLQDLVGVCRRNHSAFRHAERFGLVAAVEKPIVFWFEADQRFHLYSGES